MPKNIVICCDGTGNEFGKNNSNVIKLFSLLPRLPDQQIAYYHPGLGTIGELDPPSLIGRIRRKIKVILGKAIGYGIFSNIANSYSFLMENYSPGDKIFIFGFSRGAYTARALCSLLYVIGIMDQGCQVMVSYAVKLFKQSGKNRFGLVGHFKRIFGTECKPHFVGVWDTVNSVGWIYDPLILPFTWKNPDIKIARQALAIDERRAFFRANLWGSATNEQDIKQVWFAGNHSDVGGGYQESESGLSKIALEWMLREAEQAGLIINSEWKNEILGEDPAFVAPDFKAKMHNELKGFWWIAEYIPRRYWDMRSNPPVRKIRWPLGKNRFIPEGSLIHESVFRRKNESELSYNPTHLPNHYEVVQ